MSEEHHSHKFISDLYYIDIIMDSGAYDTGEGEWKTLLLIFQARKRFRFDLSQNAIERNE